MSTTLAAHRGYKAEYPENTIRAFQTAVEAGCDVIETDLHISADDHIIIAHDIDTSRVFGESYDVTKTNYVGTLDQLLTLREPRSKMPLFRDVLLWCIETNEQHKDRNIKLMLDIKGDNDPVQLYNLMWELLHDLKGIDFWKNKLIFGLWSPQFYIPEKLNGFKVINISFDFHSAKAFYEKVVDSHSGATIHGISMIKFILYREKDLNDMMDWLHENNLKLWLWTINNNLELKQAIEKTVKNKEILLDGIVTDDPIKVYERFPENKISWNYNFKLWLQNSLFGILLFLYRRNFNLKPAFNMLKRLGLI